jgi:hypothetical protein
MDYVDYLKLDVQVSSCHLLISNSRIRAWLQWFSFNSLLIFDTYYSSLHRGQSW